MYIVTDPDLCGYFSCLCSVCRWCVHVYCGCGCNFVVASSLLFSFCGPRWGPPWSILEVSCVMYCVLYKGSPELVVSSQLISVACMYYCWFV